MLKYHKTISRVLSVMFVGGVLLGCNIQNSETEATSAQAIITSNTHLSSVDSLYESHHEGRIYFFYDKAQYDAFRTTRYVDYSLSKIGEGYNSETLVFALNQSDKADQQAALPSIALHSNQSLAADTFYGEVERDGRLYVFNHYPSMVNFRNTGEIANRYIEINSGPEQQTVVYAGMSKKEKSGSGDMITEFKSRHALSSL